MRTEQEIKEYLVLQYGNDEELNKINDKLVEAAKKIEAKGYRTYCILSDWENRIGFNENEFTNIDELVEHLIKNPNALKNGTQLYREVDTIDGIVAYINVNEEDWLVEHFYCIDKDGKEMTVYPFDTLFNAIKLAKSSNDFDHIDWTLETKNESIFVGKLDINEKIID